MQEGCLGMKTTNDACEECGDKGMDFVSARLGAILDEMDYIKSGEEPEFPFPMKKLWGGNGAD
jgi:hypothetical protein